MTTQRTAEITRKTLETEVRVSLVLEGTGSAAIKTGIPFLDHMLTAFAKHSRIDLELSCNGDLEVDDHHSVEDCAIVLGSSLARALGEKRGIRRFGYAYAPLDEALVRCVIDLSGRSFCNVELGLTRETIGLLSLENIPHFFHSFAASANLTLHIDLLRGTNDHHKIEAAFKSLALSLREAVTLDGTDIASTKGTL